MWKVSEIFSIEADEELYQEGGEVVRVYIVCGQSVWQSWNHAGNPGVRFIDGSGQIVWVRM